MSRKIMILFFSALVIVNDTVAQDYTKNWKLKLSDCILSLGYIYQGDHFLETGLKLDYINLSGDKRIKENISLIPGGQLTRHNQVTYINPYVMLRYLRPFSDRFGGVVSVSYNYRRVLSIVSQSITPEIGININQTTTFSYGYNLFIDNKYEWTFPHRISFRLMLH